MHICHVYGITTLGTVRHIEPTWITKMYMIETVQNIKNVYIEPTVHGSPKYVYWSRSQSLTVCD